MKSQEELFNMTVMELREYMNSLSNEEIKQAAEMFEYDEHERDPLTKYGGDMVLSCDDNEFKAIVIL